LINAFSKKHDGFEGILPLLEDARRFLRFAFEPIHRHPLETYHSALVWIPEKSLIRERYGDAFGSAPQVLYGLPKSWKTALHVLPHVDMVNSIAFSADGSRIASGSVDGTVGIWNVVTGEKESELEGHTKCVKSLAFSPDGSRIVSGSIDQTVRIWNITSGEQEALLEGHTDGVTSVAFSHKGHFIVSGSKDKTVRVWNTTTYKEEHWLPVHPSEVQSVSVSQNDKYVVSGSDKIVRVWDIATGELSCELTGPSNEVKSVAVSSDSRHIAAASESELRIWDVDGIIGRKEPSAATGMTSVHIFDDNPQIVSRCLVRYGSSNARPSVAFSSDGGQVVSTIGDDDLRSFLVYIWCVQTGELMRTLEGHYSIVTSVAFSPDGSRVASGSKDQQVLIWDPKFNSVGDDDYYQGIISSEIGPPSLIKSPTGRTLDLFGTLYGLRTCAFSRDGYRVVIAALDIIYVWNHVTEIIECEFRNNPSRVGPVAFSYDDSCVVSGSDNGAVRIWDCRTKREISLYQHSGEVQYVAFSRDGRRVVFSGTRDHTVLIWNPSTGMVEGKLEPPVDACFVAFSYDDSYVVYGLTDETVWTWNVKTNERKQLTLSSGRLQLPDGTRVHSLGRTQCHTYDPVDQEAKNNTPAYLLSRTTNEDWIIGEQAAHGCWIPPEYRDSWSASVAGSTVCLLHEYGPCIMLDLKRTRPA
jgi:WD40 repeat protein